MLRDSARDSWEALKSEPWAQLFLVSWIAFDAYRVAEVSHWLGLGC